MAKRAEKIGIDGGTIDVGKEHAPKSTRKPRAKDKAEAVGAQIEGEVANVIDLGSKRKNKPNGPTSAEPEPVEDQEVSADFDVVDFLRSKGVEIGDDLPQEVIDAFKEMFATLKPALREYVGELTGDLGKVVMDMYELKQQGRDVDAVKLLVNFLDGEEKKISQIKDPEVVEALYALMDSVLNLKQVKKEISRQLKVEVASGLTNLIPLIGPLKMLTEAALGKTAAGETLEGKARALHTAEAVAFLALDGVFVAGLFTTAGTGSAAAETAKATSTSGKAVAEGLKVGKTITRFAAYIRKYGKMNKTAKTVFKFGMVVREYPMLAGAISAGLKERRIQHDLQTINSLQSKIRDEVSDSVKITSEGSDPAPSVTSEEQDLNLAA